jgi:hypothetical protein
MKTKILTSLFLLFILGINLSAQNITTSEKHGKSLNLGLGIGGYSGYYGYIGHSLPVFHIDYEFDVAKNFTLAPFINFYSFQDKYFRETVVPVGVKGSYYFDQLLNANPKWDFYLAGSLGFAIVRSTWNNDYYGPRDNYHNGRPLFLDVHIGAEYHFNDRLGAFLDISSGVSTIGFALH